VQGQECAEHGDRSAEQHAEGKRPALVEGGQNEEDHHDGEAEDGGGRNTLRSLLLLVRHAFVVKAHSGWHGLLEDGLDGIHDLAGAIAGRAGDVDLGGRIFVEAQVEVRARRSLDGGDGAQGHKASAGVVDVVLADVADVGAGGSIGFHIGLPLAAEAVEVVDQIAAHEGLHGLVDVAELHTLLQGLGLVHGDVELGHGRVVGGQHVGDFRALLECSQELVEVLGQIRRVVVAGAVFDDHGDAA